MNSNKTELILLALFSGLLMGWVLGIVSGLAMQF